MIIITIKIKTSPQLPHNECLLCEDYHIPVDVAVHAESQSGRPNDRLSGTGAQRQSLGRILQVSLQIISIITPQIHWMN